jgi:EpsI family protein
MGNQKEIKLFVLALLFLSTCVAVYGRDTNEQLQKKPPLREFLGDIEGYTLLRNIALAENAEKMLNLDDYIFADFKGKTGRSNLYIGYYYSAGKAYASHSPTICYPSQGWEIDTAPISGTLKIGTSKIKYMEITTSFGKQKELVIYWYQARLRTNTRVYKNKIDMGYNKLVFNDSHHGFVRVAVPFSDSSYVEAKKTAFDFIDSFYPHFEIYLTS